GRTFANLAKSLNCCRSGLNTRRGSVSIRPVTRIQLVNPIPRLRLHALAAAATLTLLDACGGDKPVVLAQLPTGVTQHAVTTHPPTTPPTPPPPPHPASL